MLTLPVKRQTKQEVFILHCDKKESRVKEGLHTLWENVHPLSSVQFLQDEIHTLLVNTIAWGEHIMYTPHSVDGETEWDHTNNCVTLTSADGNTLPTAEESGVQLPCEADVGSCRGPVQSQRGATHYPQNQTKQMTERGVEVIKLTTASCWSSTAAWALAHLSQTDAVNSDAADRKRLFDFRLWVCPYPRYVGHPYRTGDWTGWWGVCQRVSGQSGSTEPRGCGPSSSSCTLKTERLGGRTAQQDAAVLESENILGVWVCVCVNMYIYIITYWSRSRSRSPPCPWPVSWRSSMPKQGNVGTAIWPPGASRLSTHTTSTHTNLTQHKQGTDDMKGKLRQNLQWFKLDLITLWCFQLRYLQPWMLSMSVHSYFVC